MTVDYNDGKIHGWNGGECPVHPETVVLSWCKGGGCDKLTAKGLRWFHKDNGGDIAAFQVIKVFKDPKTIWVNEWDDGSYFVYENKDDAKKNKDRYTIRNAVKYQEVIED